MGDPRRFEVEQLPKCVKDHMKELFFITDFSGDGKAVRRLAPVGLAELDSVPG
jgi:hypothetical protein